MKVDKRKTFLWLSFCLSLYIFGIAAYIEILNYRAGNILPRTDEYYNDDPKLGLVKWRYAATQDIKGLGVASRLYSNDYELSTDNIEPNEHAPTPSFSESQPEWTFQAKRENMLHDAVIKLGLLQYPFLLISFVCMFIALVIIPKGHLYLVGICFLLNIFSLVALIGRDYFGSLGW